jgi:hypothetical protein
MSSDKVLEVLEVVDKAFEFIFDVIVIVITPVILLTVVVPIIILTQNIG